MKSRPFNGRNGARAENSNVALRRIGNFINLSGNINKQAVIDEGKSIASSRGNFDGDRMPVESDRIISGGLRLGLMELG